LRTRNVLVLVSWMLLVLAGCGGTWVDDDQNFKRVFGFDKPQNVIVLHSYYWKSSHWSTEYRYFIALRVPSQFVDGLTHVRFMTSRTPDETMVNSCGDKPQWFLPGSLTSYEAWIPKSEAGHRVFRDKADGTLFVCDEQL
jgi:hypothetical protein